MYSNIGGSFELQAKYYRFPACFLNFDRAEIQKFGGKSVIFCLKFKRATNVGVRFLETSHGNLECSLTNILEGSKKKQKVKEIFGTHHIL